MRYAFAVAAVPIVARVGHTFLPHLDGGTKVAILAAAVLVGAALGALVDLAERSS